MPISLVVLDLDGTLYRGKEPVSGASEAAAELRKQGKKLRFVTNNSGATREWVVEKLAGFGIEAWPDEVMSSGIAAGPFIAGRGWKSVFVVGEPGLIESVSAAGVQIINRGEDSRPTPESVEKPDCVLVGICRSFTYDLLNAAMQRILEGAHLAATNVDATYPIEGDGFQPGAGAILAAVKACTGAEAAVIGKPELFMLDIILEETGCAKEQTLIVGDRIETDIEWGKRAGCATHLVLTGVASEAPPNQRYSQDLLGLLAYDD